MATTAEPITYPREALLTIEEMAAVLRVSVRHGSAGSTSRSQGLITRRSTSSRWGCR